MKEKKEKKRKKEKKEKKEKKRKKEKKEKKLKKEKKKRKREEDDDEGDGGRATSWSPMGSRAGWGGGGKASWEKILTAERVNKRVASVSSMPVAKKSYSQRGSAISFHVDSAAKRRRRAERFAAPVAAAPVPRVSAKPTLPRAVAKKRGRQGNGGGARAADAESGWPVLEGTRLELEKPFLRLTKAPLPHEVRPLHVLRRSLALIKSYWVKGAEQRELDEMRVGAGAGGSGSASSSVGRHTYHYCCDQLRSIRQDLTVQHIRSAFTCEAYETSARLALETQDLGEYNRCQSVLGVLYQELGIASSKGEFLAYRILYSLHMRGEGRARGEGCGIISTLAGISPAALERDVAVGHAMRVVSAVMRADSRAFSRLYREAVSPPALSCAGRSSAAGAGAHAFRAREGAKPWACASAVVEFTGSAMRCGAVRCDTMRCDAMRCDRVHWPCSALLGSALLCSALLCSALLRASVDRIDALPLPLTRINSGTHSSHSTHATLSLLPSFPPSFHPSILPSFHPSILPPQLNSHSCRGL